MLNREKDVVLVRDVTEEVEMIETVSLLARVFKFALHYLSPLIMLFAAFWTFDQFINQVMLDYVKEIKATDKLGLYAVYALGMYTVTIAGSIAILFINYFDKLRIVNTLLYLSVIGLYIWNLFTGQGAGFGGTICLIVTLVLFGFLQMTNIIGVIKGLIMLLIIFLANKYVMTFSLGWLLLGVQAALTLITPRKK